MNIVLLHPEIPENTGNIARLCAATATPLHLIRPLGFRLDEKRMKRAGLDYWEHLTLRVHDSWEAFCTCTPGRKWLVSTKGKAAYADVQYHADDSLCLGSETSGFPAALYTAHADALIRIPINSNVRSLNLANAAAIVLYESLRQCGFCGCMS